MKGLGTWVATKGTEEQRDELTNSNDESESALVTKKERQETLWSLAISRSPIKNKAMLRRKLYRKNPEDLMTRSVVWNDKQQISD